MNTELDVWQQEREDHRRRSWIEDFPFENGNYMNICCVCHKHFTGRKHRVICYPCAHKTPTIGHKLHRLINIFKAVWRRL